MKKCILLLLGLWMVACSGVKIQHPFSLSLMSRPSKTSISIHRDIASSQSHYLKTLLKQSKTLIIDLKMDVLKQVVRIMTLNECSFDADYIHQILNAFRIMEFSLELDGKCLIQLIPYFSAFSEYDQIWYIQRAHLHPIEMLEHLLRRLPLSQVTKPNIHRICGDILKGTSFWKIVQYIHHDCHSHCITENIAFLREPSEKCLQSLQTSEFGPQFTIEYHSRALLDHFSHFAAHHSIGFLKGLILKEIREVDLPLIPSLRNLVLYNVSIDTPVQLNAFPNIVQLEMKQCQLGLNVKYGTFSYPQLKSLIMSDGTLFVEPRPRFYEFHPVKKYDPQIPLFLNMEGLESLDLSFNRLSNEDIQELLNFSWPNLQQLYLNGNLMDGSLPAFKNLPKLKALTLIANQIDNHMNLLDMDLPNLRVLDICRNRLKSLPFEYQKKTKMWDKDEYKLLPKLPQLMVLNVRHNYITSVPSLSHPNLEQLNLLNNPIRHMDAFNMPHLKSVHVQRKTR